MIRPPGNVLKQLGRDLGNTLAKTIGLEVTVPGRIIDVTLESKARASVVVDKFGSF
jgi:hypothetical protein